MPRLTAPRPAQRAGFWLRLGLLALPLWLPEPAGFAPAAVAASCAFMLPVGTAPNAIVYGSGRVEIRDMLRAGLLMNILGWGVIIAVSSVTLRWLG